ncbi:MAG: cyclic nucleotide-binding domain-containing protein [Gammaproteobacteria bacterium]|nr:cyclic nucleotide-binding domain-containing protein [Gammaproteobacteria bacterium]
MNDRSPKVLDDALITTLGKVSLFAGLSRLQLIWLLSATTRVTVGADQLYFDEGDAADSLYVFIAGEAVVEKRSGETWQILSTMKPGQAFGEMAIVDQLPRSARVRSVTNTLSLNLKGVRLESSPEVAMVIYRNIAAMQTMRLRAANEAMTSRSN